MQSYTHIIHDLAPVYDASSSVLILGSLPSVSSRGQFFYQHPRNRFWPVIACLTGESVPRTTEEKRALLLRHHIALWDVIGECDIIGSSDSSIRNVLPNDIRLILEAAPIRKIFVNGKTADRYYRIHLLPLTGREAICLPSTSPANAAWSEKRLCEAWSAALKDC